MHGGPSEAGRPANGGVEIATGSSRDSSGDFLVETRVAFEMPWNPPLFNSYDTAPRDYVSSAQLPKPGTHYVEAFGYDNTYEFVPGGSAGKLFSNVGTVTFCQTVVVTPSHYQTEIVKPAHYVTKLVKRAHWVWRHGKRIRVKATYKRVYVPAVTRQVLVPAVTKQECG